MIAWFCRNGVAANLLMIGLLAGGLYSTFTFVPLEVFPSLEMDIVTVRVPYRGATPAEVEEGVILRIEEAIYDLEGVKEIQSTAMENIGRVTVEVASGEDTREILEDLKNRVDAISTFPENTERPVYSLARRRREVISVIVSGDLAERELRAVGESVRDDLSGLPGITQVELSAIRPYEIAIELSQDTLQEYDLTFAEVAGIVRSASLDLSAGRVRTSGGEILLRTRGQAYDAEAFSDIVVRRTEDGRQIRLADIATIRDDFEEDQRKARFDGKPCVVVDVYRVGDQNAIDVSNVVKDYVALAQQNAPEGITVSHWQDRSRIIRSRLSTLLRSAALGFVFVVLLLAVFLHPSVALWVCIGIPISFAGTMLLLPGIDGTINVISLFAFILVLGIVVDDAIVTGENIYTHLRHGEDRTQAAIDGTNEVAVPVTFGVLTTAAAFIPMTMIEGFRGKIFAQIPMIVIPVLLFSLVESKLILPAHLKHVNVNRTNVFNRLQQGLANLIERLILRVYRPFLQVALHWRYTTVAFFAAAAVLIIAAVPAGRIGFVFFPRVASETATANLALEQGTPFEVTDAHITRMADLARDLQHKYIDPESGQSIIQHVYSETGRDGLSHSGRVRFQLESPENRSIDIATQDLVQEWRKAIGGIPGAKDLSFRAELIRGGAPISVQLRGRDIDQLAQVAAHTRALLQTKAGVFDIADSFEGGKEQIELLLKPDAQRLGVNTRELARQVRGAFFGAEAQRIQRGRDDVRVMVRYPRVERRSLADLENMDIRTPAGDRIPLGQIATLVPGRSFAQIERVDRERIVNVTADVVKTEVDMEAIKRDLRLSLEELRGSYPGVAYSLTGEAKEQSESMQSMFVGLLAVLAAIYVMLAIPFKDYLQPLVVMSVIPFGAAAAILGHILLGQSLSMLSLFGILALVGVVINDSLVLVDFINQKRRQGQELLEAVLTAGVRRFRPIILTSLTTFVGLTPLLLEQSTQAQFLKPMAISLGFGILFTTFVTLLLVPAGYMILEKD